MEKVIVINARFAALHCWPECPFEEVGFLKHPHRHEFHVTVKWVVLHNDRDKEFIMMKNWLTDFTRYHFANKDLGRMSCEDIADKIYQATLREDEPSGCCFVSVFEDGENGVEVMYD